MKITINDVEFSNVTELHINRELRQSDVRCNVLGDLLIDVVARKYALSVSFGLMTETELKRLRQLTENIFVTVSFPAPGGQVTSSFHISDEPTAEVKTVNGVKMYGGVRLEMKQR